MQLIVILLATVSILTFLSGAIVFFGSSKGDRIRSAWYFAAAIFATVWMASISIFLVARPNETETIDWHVIWTFVSAILIDVSFLGYGAWNKKYGKTVTLLFLILGLIVGGIIMLNPSSLYSEIILSNTGNSVKMNIGPMYFSYIAFFGAIVPVIVGVFAFQFFKTRSKRKQGGDIVTMLSFGASSTMVLIFNLILPLFNNWSLVWLGPLALAVTIIAVYYTILRYRMLNLSSAWLRILSYVVIVASVAILYMVIFSIIFAALFRGSTPSIEVIVLNFIMVLIFIALMPALNEALTFVKSLTLDNKHKEKK